MYPFQTAEPFVRNRWYIAAFADEISGRPIERTILDTPVALYRTDAGTPVAMYGLCPHRYYPLALGRVDGDALVCGYHGFAFGADGKCVRIPSQDTGAGFHQPTYRIEERGPLCWIWMGDPDRCDPALIPPYEDFGLGQPGWRYSSPNYFLMQGRAQLLVDNLMDLTHLPYVHFHIPGGESMAKTPMKEETRKASYRLDRFAKVPWTPFFDTLYGAEQRYEGLADFISRTDFYGPEFIRTGLPYITAIEGRNDVPEGIGALWILHGITPATATSTHYFGFSTRNFRLEDETLDEFQRKSDIHIRQQDVDAIEAVEARVDAAAARQRELLARSDAPAIKVRQKIQAMLEQER